MRVRVYKIDGVQVDIEDTTDLKDLSASDISTSDIRIVSVDLEQGCPNYILNFPVKPCLQPNAWHTIAVSVSSISNRTGNYAWCSCWSSI
jgi:hypothetical protein